MPFEKSNAASFGNQKCHSRNQKRKILEIKRNKLWKSKMPFEKSNTTKFRNQKYHLRNQTRHILEIKSVI